MTQAGVSEGFAPASGNYFFLKDGLGSITEVANSTGQVVQRYSYSNFGKIFKIENGGVDKTTNPDIKSPFTYTNRGYDSESGLYYYRARYYDAHSGRFLQEDPDPGKLSNPIAFSSKYIYGNSNPVTYSDPTGRFGFIAALAWTGVYTAAISAVQASLQKGNWSDNFFKNWTVNFTLSAIGLGVHGAMSGFNAAYSLGWGGVYSGAARGLLDSLLVFFKALQALILLPDSFTGMKLGILSTLQYLVDFKEENH